MRTFTQEASSNMRRLSYTDLSLETLLIIMIVSVAITVASFIMIFHQFIQIENLQRDIISLYAYLQLESIQDILWKTHLYLSDIAEGSFIKKIEVLDDRRKSKSAKESSSLLFTSQAEESRDFYHLTKNGKQERLDNILESNSASNAFSQTVLQATNLLQASYS